MAVLSTSSSIRCLWSRWEGFVAFYGTRVFLAVSLWIMLLSGAALWLLGRSAYHVGASSVLFGYFGYLVARGWYERSVTALLVALLTLVLYGSIVWGVLPTRSYISWEGHLFGLLAGVLVARLTTPQRRDTPVPNLGTTNPHRNCIASIIRCGDTIALPGQLDQAGQPRSSVGRSPGQGAWSAEKSAA